ncbi:SMC-Scp complex subunit ScpB [Bifidobacterium sp. SMB2]|uniref:SMC-Scp complex subunit ScpB n=1 Tax=Bifidobacterium saimiriisciurei TaxID=2661627 RepID=A0ABX0C7U7_9BIFI|nr:MULTISPECIES: SMC-Scp complex subunit ScpB [Bifidobacterium]NEG95785.1 SMC-Scp complex subunit ScpB [Bifidobacterium sp. SMB2]NEH11212.1 SMC-Scp complex subunit ScpB [Bifidobacterium saimiriisciurei]
MGNTAEHRTERFDPADFPGGLDACLEAMLMVADHPCGADELARALTVDVASIEHALRSLQDRYDDDSTPHGFELRHTVRGWQFASRREFDPVVTAYLGGGQQARLSQAALEALAIIAYQQPITRAQVAAIRGVNSDGVIRSLAMRGLIAERGVDDETHAALLATSDLFLEHMGLHGLDELPSLAPFLPGSADEAAQ